MAKSVKYNYAFVFYDIGEKRVQKVFKICKKYFKHHQKSVFRGDVTPANLLKMKSELKRIIVPEEDYVSIIKLYNSHSFDEETIGNAGSECEDIIL